MSSKEDNHFEGFSAETVFFLKNLKENNNREWFLARKKDYNRKVLQPASQFILEMGQQLKKLAPEINAVPKVNRSICRIYRDTRYSSDKVPYKTHLGIWFWQGSRKVNKSTGYYFELRPEHIYLSVGMTSFSRRILNQYRKAVATPNSGEKLVKIVNTIQQNSDYQMNKEYFKHVPTGFHLQGKRSELIRFNALFAETLMSIPPELYNKKILKLCFNIFKDLSPLQQWLVNYVQCETK